MVEGKGSYAALLATSRRCAPVTGLARLFPALRYPRCATAATRRNRGAGTGGPPGRAGSRPLGVTVRPWHRHGPPFPLSASLAQGSLVGRGVSEWQNFARRHQRRLRRQSTSGLVRSRHGHKTVLRAGMKWLRLSLGPNAPRASLATRRGLVSGRAQRLVGRLNTTPIPHPKPGLRRLLLVDNDGIRRGQVDVCWGVHGRREHGRHTWSLCALGSRGKTCCSCTQVCPCPGPRLRW
jgi:hypothetical protein